MSDKNPMKHAVRNQNERMLTPMSDKNPKTHTIEVEITEHDKGAMFLRSVRAESEDGKVEVAVNEMGAGIIVRVDGRTFTLHEVALAQAVEILCDE